MKNQVTIFHNPKCSKSREALQLLQEKGAEITTVTYLKTPPSKKELKEILMKLGISAESLLRKKEALFLEKFKNVKFTEEEWITVMTENPILIERPIVIKGYKAVIGRPPELVLDLFSSK